MRFKKIMTLLLVLTFSTSTLGFTTPTENLVSKQALLNEFEKSKEITDLEPIEETVDIDEFKTYLVDVFNDFISNNEDYDVERVTFDSIVNTYAEQEIDRLNKRDFESRKDYIKEMFIEYAKHEVVYKNTLAYYSNKNRGQVAPPASEDFPKYIDDNEEDISTTTAQDIDNSEWNYFLTKNRVVLTESIGDNPNVVIDSKYKVNGKVYYTDLYGTFRDNYGIVNISVNVIDDDVLKLSSGGMLFAGSDRIKSISFEGVDTSNVTGTLYMFHGCESLTELDLSNFNTSNVDVMQVMFLGCSSLTELDLSSFDTSKVYNMYAMFAGCSNLRELNLGNFDTSNVEAMFNMFDDCNRLELIISPTNNKLALTYDAWDEDCIIVTTDNVKLDFTPTLGGNFRTDINEDVQLKPVYKGATIEEAKKELLQLELIISPTNNKLALTYDAWDEDCIIVTTDNVKLDFTPTLGGNFRTDINEDVQLKPVYKGATIEEAKKELLQDINAQIHAKGHDYLDVKYFAIKGDKTFNNSDKINITNDSQNNFDNSITTDADILLAFELKDNIFKTPITTPYTAEPLKVDVIKKDTAQGVFIDSIPNAPTDIGTHTITVQPVKGTRVRYNGKNFLMAKDGKDLTTTVHITKVSVTPNMSVANTNPIVYGDTLILNISLDSSDIKTDRDELTVNVLKDNEVLHTFTTRPNTTKRVEIKSNKLITGTYELKITTTGNNNIEAIS